MRNLLVCIFSGIVLTACASGPPTYYRYFATENTEATYQELLSDRYACSQETSGLDASSSARVNANVGVANSSSRTRVLPNCSIFRACLAARGWVRIDGVIVDDPSRPYGFGIDRNLTVSCTN